MLYLFLLDPTGSANFKLHVLLCESTLYLIGFNLYLSCRPVFDAKGPGFKPDSPKHITCLLSQHVAIRIEAMTFYFSTSTFSPHLTHPGSVAGIASPGRL
jgi:hypothetical protein